MVPIRSGREHNGQRIRGMGAGFYAVPTLKITFPDGNRDLALDYRSHTIQNNVLRISLKDIQRGVVVELSYEMDPSTGALTRSARIENDTKASFTIE